MIWRSLAQEPESWIISNLLSLKSTFALNTRWIFTSSALLFITLTLRAIALYSSKTVKDNSTSTFFTLSVNVIIKVWASLSASTYVAGKPSNVGLPSTIL